MIMYRESATVDDIIQRIMLEEEPVNLLPAEKRKMDKTYGNYEHFLWTVHKPDVSYETPGRFYCRCYHWNILIN